MSTRMDSNVLTTSLHGLRGMVLILNLRYPHCYRAKSWLAEKIFLTADCADLERIGKRIMEGREIFRRCRDSARHDKTAFVHGFANIFTLIRVISVIRG